MAVGTGTIIAVVILCILIIVGTILAVYFTKVTCPDFGYECTPATSSPAPMTASPKENLQAQGQAIQTSELVISQATPPIVSTQPTGVTATGSFTLSIDINMTTLPNGSLMRVFGQGVHPGHPGLWLFPAGSGGDVWLRYHIGNTAIDLVTGTAAPVYNTYYNLTAVYDATTHTATLYYNGALKNSSSSIDPAGFTPPATANFTFNQQNLTSPTVKVRNIYWFNKALTAAEVSTLVGVSTTSTYIPEPVSGFTSEGYMVEY